MRIEDIQNKLEILRRYFNKELGEIKGELKQLKIKEYKCLPPEHEDLIENFYFDRLEKEKPLGKHLSVNATALYDEYKSYAKSHNQEPLSQKTFGEKMACITDGKTRKSDGFYYHGISIKGD
jgi:D5 protein-like